MHEGWNKERYHETSDNFSAFWSYPQYIVNLSLLPDEERAKCIDITKHNYFEQHERVPKAPLEKNIYTIQSIELM